MLPSTTPAYYYYNNNNTNNNNNNNLLIQQLHQQRQLYSNTPIMERSTNIKSNDNNSNNSNNYNQPHYLSYPLAVPGYSNHLILSSNSIDNNNNNYSYQQPTIINSNSNQNSNSNSIVYPSSPIQFNQISTPPPPFTKSSSFNSNQQCIQPCQIIQTPIYLTPSSTPLNSNMKSNDNSNNSINSINNNNNNNNNNNPMTPQNYDNQIRYPIPVNNQNRSQSIIPQQQIQQIQQLQQLQQLQEIQLQQQFNHNHFYHHMNSKHITNINNNTNTNNNNNNNLNGNISRKRRRRKYCEIKRIYKCEHENCDKSYGTLNHLNFHIQLQKHGKKRLASEFKSLNK